MPHRWSRRQVVQGAGAMGLGLLPGCGRWPGQAQSPSRVPRIGYVGAGSAGERYAKALQVGLSELGYTEGDNLTVEWRITGGARERVAEAVADLVALPVDAIVVTGVIPAQVAQSATRSIPIIFVMLSDPVESGFVSSLARPGGNLTGLGSFALELSGKQLQLLAEAIPSVARVGVLWQVRHVSKAQQLKEIQDAAPVLGLQVESLPADGPNDLPGAIQAAIQAPVDALFTLQSDLTVGQQARILELVEQARLPGMYEVRDWTEAGGLLSYGPSFRDMHQRAAYYVDRILRGARPADLPVERPRAFDFAINLRTAQALGLTIPHHVLLQATEVIQ
jgi:putative tryptophan/tyrosine transport system substrate-binding protein